MRALGWWLLLVGTLRLASVWFGFFNIWALRLAVFSKAEMLGYMMSALNYERTEGALWCSYSPILAIFLVLFSTFGIWTLLTSTLCYFCAFNLDNKALYNVTLLSFIYALGHFVTEYLFYNTMATANLTTVGFFAGTSIVWMLLEWKAHQPVASSKQV